MGAKELSPAGTRQGSRVLLRPPARIDRGERAWSRGVRARPRPFPSLLCVAPCSGLSFLIARPRPSLSMARSQKPDARCRNSENAESAEETRAIERIAETDGLCVPSRSLCELCGPARAFVGFESDVRRATSTGTAFKALVSPVRLPASWGHRPMSTRGKARSIVGM